jgi:ferredoxin
MKMGIVEKLVDKIVNNHHMTVENRLCSRFRSPKAGCSKCTEVCPAGSITLSEKGAEIGGGCAECGVCISSCPNGVFSARGRDDATLSADLLARANGRSRTVFRISCAHGDGTSDLIVPCLGRLTEALLLAPFRAGAPGIEILRPACEACPSRRGAPHFERVLRGTGRLCEMLGLGAHGISVTSSKYHDRNTFEREDKDPDPEPFSRRAFFSTLKTEVLGAAAFPPETKPAGDGGGESFRDLIRKNDNAKRSLLLEALRDLAAGNRGGEAGPANEPRASRPAKVPSDEAITAELEVDSKCTACGVCAALCPAGALTEDRADKKYSLKFRPALCTNCRVCAEACMPKALRIKDESFLERLLEEAEVGLFEARERSCVVCGLAFVGEGSAICPLCAHVHDRQMTAIRGLFEKRG